VGAQLTDVLLVVAGGAVTGTLILHVAGERRIHVQPVWFVINSALRDM